MKIHFWKKKKELVLLSAKNMLQRPKTLTQRVKEGTFPTSSLLFFFKAYSCLRREVNDKAFLIVRPLQHADMYLES